MYRGKRGAKLAKDTEHDDRIFVTLCQVTSMDNTKRASMDRHVFDKFTKGWLRKCS